MVQNVLNHRRKITPQHTILRLPTDEQFIPVKQKKKDDLDSIIKLKLGDALTLLSKKPPELELYDFADLDIVDKEESLSNWINGDPIDVNSDLIVNEPVIDTLINAEVILPQGSEKKVAVIKRRCTD